MNDIAAPGGPSTQPMPDIDYEPIDLDVDSIQSLGKALQLQADNVKTAASGIKAKMGVEASGKLNETAHLPVGSGLQDLTLTEFAKNNNERMAEIGGFFDNVETSLRNLGKLSALIASEFGDLDGLNAAGINEVQQILGNHGSTTESTEV